MRQHHGPLLLSPFSGVASIFLKNIPIIFLSPGLARDRLLPTSCRDRTQLCMRECHHDTPGVRSYERRGTCTYLLATLLDRPSPCRVRGGTNLDKLFAINTHR